MAQITPPSLTGKPLGMLVKDDTSFSTASTAFTDVTGLTGLTVNCPAAILVELTCRLNNNTANQFSAARVFMDDTTALCQTPTFRSINANDEYSVVTRQVVTGLTPASQHTFDVQVTAVFGGTVVMGCDASHQAVLTVRPA